MISERLSFCIVILSCHMCIVRSYSCVALSSKPNPTTRVLRPTRPTLIVFVTYIYIMCNKDYEYRLCGHSKKDFAYSFITMKVEQTLVAIGHTSVQRFLAQSLAQGRWSPMTSSLCGQPECWLMNSLVIPALSHQPLLTSAVTQWTNYLYLNTPTAKTQCFLSSFQRNLLILFMACSRLNHPHDPP